MYLILIFQSFTFSGAEIECKDNLGNTALANAVHGQHNSCALMLIQNDADVNVLINKMKKSEDQDNGKKKVWKYFLEHWNREQMDTDENPKTIFEGIVSNNWLGITYMVLNKLEKSTFSLAKAIEVAFKLEKFQFAKTLLSRSVSDEELNEILDSGRNLLNCLAFYCKSHIEEDLVTDIFQTLVEAGVSANKADDYGCIPLHSAALLKNETLVQLFAEKDLNSVNSKDNFGRTPLDAFFWNYSKTVKEEETILDITSLEVLFEKKADCNHTSLSKPLNFLQSSYDAQFENIDFYQPLKNLYIEKPNVTVETTPLMIAIAFKDLVMIEYLISKGAELNILDSAGRSALMVALKTNDQEIIQMLLTHESKIHWNSLDKFGYSIIDHAVAFDPSNTETFTFDNDEILKKLLIQNFDPIIIENGLMKAKECAANKCGKIIALHLGESYKGVSKCPCDISMEFDISSNFDHTIDSSVMMEMKALELTKKEEKECLPIPKGCSVKNGQLLKDYDILLNKVDVQFSQCGLYNFYRMQIWKEEHKELFILFTNWGRIERYMNGQYQNTPFSQADEAIQEFTKIFKSKTGNDWSNRNSFEEKYKKYRIVHTDHATKIVRPSFKVDLMTNVESQLPMNLQIFMKDISHVNILKTAYIKEKLVDSSSIPFERIDKKAIEKAKAILSEIKHQIEVKTRLQEKIRKSGHKYEIEVSELFNKCCKLSNQYYCLVPTSGFEFEKVPPIDSEHVLNQEEKKLRYLQEFETAKSILLGAMLRKDIIHPLDYVFKSLDCKITEINEDSIEGKLIQQYIYNSRGMLTRYVENIFKLQRFSDANKFDCLGKPNNRKLLWHGTDASNLISILKNGLLLDAPFANKTGRAYGDGVYFADIFDKSYGYSRGDFILLCDVELGDSQVCFTGMIALLIV